MNPSQLKSFLQTLVTHDILEPVMIWGAPGIGKSTIVATIAKEEEIQVVDLRLSQLAPSDLRGLPVPDKETKTAHWYPITNCLRNGMFGRRATERKIGQQSLIFRPPSPTVSCT